MVFEFAWGVVNDDLNYLHLESTSCSRGQFQCKSGKCISGDKVCNLDYNCGDETTEDCGMFD